jgi:NodT family efflux transporter outer membrane factor (OMF) lipoprotein
MPFEASWEPDLWGRVRKSVQASAFAAQAAVADLENVRLSAQAELAADYYGLRAQDVLQQVLDSTVSANRRTFALSRVLFVAGRGTGEAVAQAEAQFKATEARATNVGLLRAQYEHAIAVLVGEPPSTFAIPVDLHRSRPPTIPVGVPSELLERRPDVAAAERTIAQANAQIGIAKTAYFPIVALDASGGVMSTSLARLFTWPSRAWSIGPNLLQTIFDGGVRKATVEQYQAAYDQTVANYRQTVLTAFQEVEDNLAALRILAKEAEQQDAAVDAARKGLRQALIRYRSGLDPYLNVVVAQAALLNLEETAVSLMQQRMVASVQLIKALGGGWDASRLPTPKQLVDKNTKVSP